MFTVLTYTNNNQSYSIICLLLLISRSFLCDVGQVQRYYVSTAVVTVPFTMLNLPTIFLPCLWLVCSKFSTADCSFWRHEINMDRIQISHRAKFQVEVVQYIEENSKRATGRKYNVDPKNVYCWPTKRLFSKKPIKQTFRERK